MNKRTFGLASIALAAFVFVRPAAADGLSRFNELIKPQLPADGFVYKNASALGENGFVLEDVVITPPADSGKKVAPIKIKRIAFEDLDFDSLQNNAPPNYAKIRLEGIAISDKPSEGVDLGELAGLKGVNADFNLDYRLDPDKQTFTLSRAELDVAGLGRLELTMILDGVSPEMAGDTSKAMDNSSLRTASVVFEDRSLMAKVMPAIAKAQGTDADALIASLKPMVDGMIKGQGPKTQEAANALVAFISDYKQPKGPLRVTLNPPSKTSASQVMAAGGPEDVIKALGLVVSYSGAK